MAENMAVLRSMFQEMDDDVLQIVLEANGMNLPRTIDALLEMQAPATTAAVPAQDKISLPDDFLRPPSYFRKSPTRQSEQQIQEDALLARLIQDEMFMNHIANNPDILNSQPSSQISSPHGTSRGSPKHRSPRSVSVSSSHSRRTSSDSSGSFREKISTLGTSARRKLARLAARLKKRDSQAQGPAQDYFELSSLDDPDADNGLIQNDPNQFGRRR